VQGIAGDLSGSLLPGGRSNLTYEVTDGARRWVIRRPPLGHVLPTAHDMSREWRVISALQPTDIPVPATIAFCDDPDVLGAPFYVMEFVEGHVVRDRLPRDFPRTATTRAVMSAALVETLAQLHTISPDDIGLSDFGRPERFLERQVRRWWQQWEGSKTRELPAIEELHRRLEAAIPPQSPSGIVHGDFRLDNVLYSPHDPSKIVALLDWEMSTVGDPLCDLGLLIVYWPDSADDPAVTALHAGGLCLDDGFYSRATLIHEYQVDSHRDLSNLEWYIALGSYKLAIIAEGIAKRHAMGMTVGSGFETMAEAVPLIVESALERAAHSGMVGLRAG